VPESPAGQHRRDIDGLRAVAVVPVVLFHVGVPGFRGGFVGVNVLFRERQDLAKPVWRNEARCVAAPCLRSAPSDCVIGDPAVGAVDFAVWSDSHAEAFFPAIDAASKRARVAGLFFGWQGCPPVVQVSKLERGVRDTENRACTADVETVPEFAFATPNVLGRLLMHDRNVTFLDETQAAVDERSAPVERIAAGFPRRSALSVRSHPRSLLLRRRLPSPMTGAAPSTPTTTTLASLPTLESPTECPRFSGGIHSFTASDATHDHLKPAPWNGHPAASVSTMPTSWRDARPFERATRPREARSSLTP
jgi:SGNH domain (fused to AT3 domains)